MTHETSTVDMIKLTRQYFLPLMVVMAGTPWPAVAQTPQTHGPTPAATSKPVSVTRAASESKRGMIHGAAVDNTHLPVRGATVRLRNLETKQIELTQKTSETGEFSFPATPDSPYIIELTTRAGDVVMVSDVIVVHAGEVASAIVGGAVSAARLGGLLGNSAAAFLTAAGNAGVATLGSSLPPASPEK